MNVCVSGGSFCREFTACARVHVWACASMHGSVCVCVWSIYVCVSVLGSHWTDPQPFLNTETASPALFFMCCLLQTQFPWNCPFFGLFRGCMHCKWLLWSLPRASGGRFKDKRKQRETDRSKGAALPLLGLRGHQQFLFSIFAQTNAQPSQVFWKKILDCFMQLTLSYHSFTSIM